MDTILQEDDIDDELKDFMTNFKFPWESEEDEVKENKDNSNETGITRVGRKSAGHLYLSDTTPARKGKRLSGKNLTKDYLVAVGHSGSPVTADRVLSAQSAEDTSSTKNNDLQEGLNHVKSCEIESHSDNEHQTKDRSQSDQFVQNDYLLQTNKKKKRQSSYFKRRESWALLKTIGEVSSPCQDKLQEVSSKLEDVEEKSVSQESRSQQELKKPKARTSRRRSTRLSGISCPMLELGTNGIPKLVQQPQSLLLKSMRSEVPDCGEEHPAPTVMEIQAEKPFEKDEKFKNIEQKLEYRHIIESPVTPLQSSKPAVEGCMGSQYYTPQSDEVSKVELCTPEQAVLSSLSTMQLQAQCSSDSPKEQELDNCLPLESFGTSCEEIPCQPISVAESSMLEATYEKNKIPENLEKELLEESHSKCENQIEGDLGEKRETEIDVSEWKENLDNSTSSIAPSCFTCTSSSSPCDEMEVDPEVKEIYLKKGQLKPFKRTNTNLETVFEEQRTDVVSFGKRKYRRSLAFPEKPWVPRSSKRGTKNQKGCKKRRLSLSKTSKRNDAVLGERLNNILDSLVEES